MELQCHLCVTCYSLLQHGDTSMYILRGYKSNIVRSKNLLYIWDIGGLSIAIGSLWACAGVDVTGVGVHTCDGGPIEVSAGVGMSSPAWTSCVNEVHLKNIKIIMYCMLSYNDNLFPTNRNFYHISKNGTKQHLYLKPYTNIICKSFILWVNCISETYRPICLHVIW